MFSISSGNCFVFSQSEFLISKGSFMEILTELEQLEVYACHIMPTGLYPSSRLTMLQTLAFYRCRHTCNGTAISDAVATWLLLPVVGISAICCHMLDDDQLGADSRCTVKECGCSRRNWLIFNPQTYCIYEREFPFECGLRRGGGGGGGGAPPGLVGNVRLELDRNWLFYNLDMSNNNQSIIISWYGHVCRVIYTYACSRKSIYFCGTQTAKYIFNRT